MKFYLAASYLRREEMAEKASQLVERGHSVTSRWVSGAHHIPKIHFGGTERHPLADRYGNEDLDDLADADVVVVFTEPNDAPRTTGGRHVEYGYALGLHDRGKGNQIAVIGPLENIFYHLGSPTHYFRTWAAFLRRFAPAAYRVTPDGAPVALA